MKIKDLKIGTRVFLGRYSSYEGRNIPLISWLKASKDLFISEYALDMLYYDAKEHLGDRGYNPDYNLSNIKQYLNSSDVGWFEPSHEFDARPIYADRKGFLSDFRDYEVVAINGKVDLPTIEMLIGSNKLPIFKKRGVRPRASQDLIQKSRTSWRMATIEPHNYTNTLTCSPDPLHRAWYVLSLGRDASGELLGLTCMAGIRPICSILDQLEVRPSPEGEGFELIPFEVSVSENEFSDDEFKDFLDFI